MKVENNIIIVPETENSCLLAHLQPEISDCLFDPITIHSNHFYEVEK